MQKFKVGIIGCGHIGKRHAAIFDQHEQTQLVSVCDIELTKADELAALYDVGDIAEDYHYLLRQEIDIVSICTPHYLHKKMALEAIRAGKNVIVEKPMALSAADADEMTLEAKKAGLKLYVVKQNRFNVPIVITNEALQQKKLGKIFMVQCNVMWNRHQEYYDQSEWRGFKEKEGGALFTQASHFIDILVWWFGDVVSAKTELATQHHQIEIEDAGSSALIFTSGVVGSLTWTTNVYNKNYEGSITIIGEQGTIKIGGAYLNKIEFWDVMSYPLPENISFVDTPNNYGKYQGSSSNHHRVIEEVIKDLSGQRSDIVDGQEGERSIKAIEKIYAGTYE
jgi:predicted dehydrogenase